MAGARISKHQLTFKIYDSINRLERLLDPDQLDLIYRDPDQPR